ANKDGTVTGFKVDLLANMGAYLGLITSGVPILGGFMYNGIYKFPAYQFTCHNVFTNTAHTDAYRGAGRPDATVAVARMMYELATELGVHAHERRRRTWIRHEEFRYTTAAGRQYVAGNCEAATERALELFGYDELRAEQQRRREPGDPVQLGI